MSKTRNQRKQDRSRIVWILSVAAWAIFVIAVLLSAPAKGQERVKGEPQRCPELNTQIQED